MRRLYFTLTGLPPSPEALQKWTSALRVSSFAPRKEEFSSQPFAERKPTLEKLVDELLTSDRYGERWGRHWLDVARFAESTGGDHNNIYQHAWRYRDYVIDAFNHDKPFDTFDYKPRLKQSHGKPSNYGSPWCASPWKFNQHGDSGMWISELFPNVARHADDLCLLNGMHCDQPAHAQAFIQMHTGISTGGVCRNSNFTRCSGGSRGCQTYAMFEQYEANGFGHA